MCLDSAVISVKNILSFLQSASSKEHLEGIFEFWEVWCKRPFGLKNELIRIWWSIPILVTTIFKVLFCDCCCTMWWNFLSSFCTHTVCKKKYFHQGLHLPFVESGQTWTAAWLVHGGVWSLGLIASNSSLLMQCWLVGSFSSFAHILCSKNILCSIQTRGWPICFFHGRYL